MKILRSDSNERELFLILESETEIPEGKHYTFMIDKIELKDAVVAKLPGTNQYHVTYEDVSLPDNKAVYDSQAMFRAHQLTEQFEGAKCLPCDFPRVFFESIQEQHKDSPVKAKCEVIRTPLGPQIVITFIENEEAIAVYERSMVQAYIDYLLCAGIRGCWIFYPKENEFGSLTKPEVSAYMERLNERLDGLAIVNGFYQGFATFGKNHLTVQFNLKSGHYVRNKFPSVVINKLMAEQIDLPIEVQKTETSISLTVDWNKIVHPSVMCSLKYSNWNQLSLIGTVK